MLLTKPAWIVTPEAFDSLLLSLHPDRDDAGRQYENIRRKLLEFFEARGSNSPEDHTDETFDRVMRRMAEGERIDNPGGYCYGVARFVWKEASRNRAKDPIELDENTLILATARPGDLVDEERLKAERRLDCLDRCLDQLADQTRKFIIEYYRDEEGVKIEQRKLLAAQLNTSLNALRLRASRLRRELGSCTTNCVESDAGRNQGVEKL